MLRISGRYQFHKGFKQTPKDIEHTSTYKYHSTTRCMIMGSFLGVWLYNIKHTITYKWLTISGVICSKASKTRDPKGPCPASSCRKSCPSSPERFHGKTGGDPDRFQRKRLVKSARKAGNPKSWVKFMSQEKPGGFICFCCDLGPTGPTGPTSYQRAQDQGCRGAEFWSREPILEGAWQRNFGADW